MTAARRGSRMWSVLGIAFLLILLVAGTGVVVLRSVLTPEKLRTEIVRTTEQATGLDVTLDTASLSFTPLGISLTNLRIGATDPPLLEMESGLARLELAPLLRRSVVVSRVVLTRPRVSLRPDGPGGAPASGPPAAAAGPAAAVALPAAAGFRGAIRNVEIVDGSFQIVAPEGGEDVVVQGIGLRGRVDVAKGGRSVRSTGELSLSEPFAPPLEARFESEASGLPDRPVIDITLHPETDGGTLVLTGRIAGLEEPGGGTYELAARGDLDLELLARRGLLPEGIRAGGRVDLDVRAEGSSEDSTAPALSGTVKLTDARVSAPDLAVPAEAWDGTLRLAGTDVVIERLTGRLGSSAFDARGRIRSALDRPSVRLAGTCPRLDLAELASPAGSGSRPDGSPDAARTLDAQAAAPLVPLLPSFPLELRLEIDSLLTEGAPMTGVVLTTTGQGGTGRVEARARSADFDGIVLHDAEAQLELDGHTALGDFRSPRVEAHRVPLTGVRGKIRMAADRVLYLEDMTGALWGGRAQGKARLDFTDPLSPAFEIETTAQGVQANDFFSAVTPARDVVFGALDLSSSFSSKGVGAREVAEALTGRGTLTAKDGKVANTRTTTAIWDALNIGENDDIPFRDLVGAFEVRDGKIHTDHVELVGANASWTARGAVAFDGALDYNIQVELDDELSNLYRKRLGRDLADLLAGSTGRLVIDLKVAGSARDPKVAVDRKKLAERLGSKLGDAVKDLSEGLKRLLD